MARRPCRTLTRPSTNVNNTILDAVALTNFVATMTNFESVTEDAASMARQVRGMLDSNLPSVQLAVTNLAALAAEAQRHGRPTRPHHLHQLRRRDGSRKKHQGRLGLPATTGRRPPGRPGPGGKFVEGRKDENRFRRRSSAACQRRWPSSTPALARPQRERDLEGVVETQTVPHQRAGALMARPTPNPRHYATNLGHSDSVPEPVHHGRLRHQPVAAGPDRQRGPRA